MTLHLMLTGIARHGLMMLAYEGLLMRAQFLTGVAWIYLPAGTRLLCTLPFGQAGAVGQLIAGWCAC